MRRLIFLIVIILLYSCKDKTVKNYERLVEKADKIVITERDHDDTIIVKSAIVLQNLKDILKRNIKPETPRKFIIDKSINLYAGDRKLGLLMVGYGEKPYINFRSDSLCFTFPLTYGIGMALDELSSENSR